MLTLLEIVLAEKAKAEDRLRELRSQAFAAEAQIRMAQLSVDYWIRSVQYQKENQNG